MIILTRAESKEREHFFNLFFVLCSMFFVLMYNIIPLILICVSLFIIIVIIVRKFPALANLDVENMPAEKEARFKEQIITGRMEKSLAKWKVRLGRFFGFIAGGIGTLFRFIHKKLQEAKKKYSSHPAALPPEDKETMIKELLQKNAGLDDRENFEEKEANLIKIIELEPRNSEIFIVLGNLYAANKKYEEGKQAFAHVLKLLGDEESDKQAEVYYDLAEIYRDTAEAENSLETIKMAVKLAPNNPRYLDALLEISIMNKDKISAQDALEKLSVVNPENGKLAEFKEADRRIWNSKNDAVSRLWAAFLIKDYKFEICNLDAIDKAVVAQLVEHLHGKEGVSGPIPDNGSKKILPAGVFF